MQGIEEKITIFIPLLSKNLLHPLLYIFALNAQRLTKKKMMNYNFYSIFTRKNTKANKTQVNWLSLILLFLLPWHVGRFSFSVRCLPLTSFYTLNILIPKGWWCVSFTQNETLRKEVWPRKNIFHKKMRKRQPHELLLLLLHYSCLYIKSTPSPTQKLQSRKIHM